MKKASSRPWLAIILFFLLAMARPVCAESAPDASEHVLVGRVSHVEGQLLRYVPETDDWVAVLADAPFGLDDALYSSERGKAEFIIPNGTAIKIDGATQIQMVVLNADLTHVDVASGIARLSNRNEGGIVKATTPFGYIVGGVGTEFDLLVGDQAVEVIAIQGMVDFVLEEDKTRYEVTAGSESIVSDGFKVTSGDSAVDADWHAWNEDRGRIWEERLAAGAESADRLPEGLRDDAYVLEENGRWESVSYRGETQPLWRPTNVAPDWEPFTAGRWTVYHGDNTWMPDEPFGYVTHHYGNWVYVDDRRAWYWAPPAARAVVATPVLNIGFSWYPGRVSWIHSGAFFGWIPLAPYERYYAHRHWGPRTRVVRDVTRVHIRINRFKHVNRAVIIKRTDFYRVNDYRTVRISNVNRATIIKRYRAAPFINNRVFPNYSRIRERHNFRNVEVSRIPHRVVRERIERNRKMALWAGRERAVGVERELRRIKEGRLERDAGIERPRASNRLVERGRAKIPRERARFEERTLKQREWQLENAEERRKRAHEMRERQRAREKERETVRPQRGRERPERELRERRQDRQLEQRREREQRRDRQRIERERREKEGQRRLREERRRVEQERQRRRERQLREGRQKLERERRERVRQRELRHERQRIERERREKGRQRQLREEGRRIQQERQQRRERRSRQR
jgi:hypothetical protein